MAFKPGAQIRAEFDRIALAGARTVETSQDPWLDSLIRVGRGRCWTSAGRGLLDAAIRRARQPCRLDPEPAKRQSQ